jgi:hypothetical protein
MATITRRASMAGMLGLAAGAAMPRASFGAAQAPDAPVPAEGIGRRIRHLGFTDLGGKPDSVQIMPNRGHLFVGHMFTDGVTVVDASNPRQPRPVHYFKTADNTRTHHMQVANDLLLLGEGANIVAMQSYDNARGYFENTLADSLTNRKPFRSGLSIHDISRPAQPRQIAFLEMPGIGINRLWWTGGRYAYVAVHLEGFTDTILVIVDVQNTMKPEIVSRWWLPGMNRAGGETPPASFGKRTALHHLISAGNVGYAAWRDGGYTIHDLSDPANPKLLSHRNYAPPFGGGAHTPLPLPNRKLLVLADEATSANCANGLAYTWVVDVREPSNPVSIATLPTPDDENFCAKGAKFGPHNLHENRPGSLQSDDFVFATYHNAGLRIYDIRDPFHPKQVGYFVPPAPEKIVDQRPNPAKVIQSCDVFVDKDGLMYLTDTNAGLYILQYEGSA